MRASRVIEGELTFLPVAALLLNASFGYNDFKYQSLSQQALNSEAWSVFAYGTNLTD